jgi:HAD superfamily hydrolase (TIGR01509 family)
VIAEEASRLGIHFAEGKGPQTMRGRSMISYKALLEQRLGKPPPAGFETTLRDAMAEAFRARLRPMPGAAWMLDRLKVPFCLATIGPRSKAALTLTLGIAGLLHYFDVRLVSAYEVGYFKPDPGLFLAAAKSLGAEPRHCAVVEDSDPGLRAAVAAEMTAYAICHAGHRVPADLRGQVVALDRLEDVLALQEPTAI